LRCIQTCSIQKRHKQRYLSQIGCELIPGWSCCRCCKSIVVVSVMRMKNCYSKTWQECFYYCNVYLFLFPYVFFCRSSLQQPLQAFLCWIPITSVTRRTYNDVFSFFSSFFFNPLSFNWYLSTLISCIFYFSFSFHFFLLIVYIYILASPLSFLTVLACFFSSSSPSFPTIYSYFIVLKEIPRDSFNT